MAINGIEAVIAKQGRLEDEKQSEAIMARCLCGCIRHSAPGVAANFA